MKKKIIPLLVSVLAVPVTANAQWNTDQNPIVVSGNESGISSPKIARTDDGNTFVSWCKSSDGFKLYLQLLDVNGNKKFNNDGLLVDNHKTPSWRSDYSLVSTSDNCAIVSFSDSRSEEEQEVERYQAFQPAFYKIDQQQNFLWGLDGLTFNDVLEAAYTEIMRVGDDIYIHWEGLENEVSKFNRVSADGVVAWDGHKEFSGQIVPSVGTDFIVVYTGSDGAMAQRYTRDYTPVWSEPVCLSSYSYGGYSLHPYELAQDGKGGVVVTFMRLMGVSHMITSQHVSADGELEFGLNSIDVYTPEEGDHDYCFVTADKNTGKSLTTWAMKGTDGSYSFAAQQFSSNGDRESGDKGWVLDNKESASGYAFSNIGAGSLSNGDWIVAYTDDLWWGNSNCYVARYDQTGKQIWKTQIGDRGKFNDATLIVEEDCSYLVFQREGTGVMAARIYNDGTFSKSSGISEIKSDTDASKKTYYTIDGKLLSSAQKGLNIVKMNDGTVKKVVVRQ